MKFCRCCFSVFFCILPATASSLTENCKASVALDSTSSDTAYETAGTWFANHNQLPCAVAAFREAVRINPRSYEAHYNLGLAYVQLQKLPEAEAALRETLAEEPTFVPAVDQLAQLLASERRYAPAIGLWNKALTIQPGSPEMTLSLAVATYKDGDSTGAIRLLKSLAIAHPDFTPAHFNLANAYAHQSRFREAADEYKKTVDLEPRNNDASLAMVKALVSGAFYNEALPPAKDYVQRNPDSSEGHLALGLAYRELGRYDAAESELARAASLDANNADAQYNLGFVLSQNGKPSEALPHLKKAVQLAPSHSPAQFQLTKVLRALHQDAQANRSAQEFKAQKESDLKRNRLAAKGNEANQLLLSGQTAQAAALYREMARDNPQNARIYYDLALALKASKDAKSERDALEKAVSVDPKFAAAQIELGQLEMGEGHWPAAEARFKAAVAIDPGLSKAQSNLGVSYAVEGKLAEAETAFQRAIEDDPKNGDASLNLGLILAQQGQFREAESKMKAAALLSPANPRVLTALGKVEARLGKSEDAIQIFRKIIEAQPNSAESHLNLAIALADRSELPEALKEASASVQLAPESAAAQYNRGRILFDLGQTGQAKADLETAIRLGPRSPDPLYFLALIEKQLGDFPQESLLLQKLVKMQPGNATAFYLLGQSLQHQSKEAQAIAAWQQAIAINPDYAEALWNLSRILQRSDPAGAKQMSARFSAVQRKQHILDRVQTLATQAYSSMQMHDWTQAVADLKEAIPLCGDCAAQADLHKNLGLATCHLGDLATGEKELRTALSEKHDDPDIERALALVAHSGHRRSLEYEWIVPAKANGYFYFGVWDWLRFSCRALMVRPSPPARKASPPDHCLLE